MISEDKKEIINFKKDRLMHTIQCRQALINHFETYLNKLYKSIDASSLKINLDDKNAVDYYFFITGVRIDDMRDFFAMGGTSWQKSRCSEKLSRKTA